MKIMRTLLVLLLVMLAPLVHAQYYDKETGLNYNTNRDYDPATGRYIQSDPVGLKGGVNTYVYVEGNPVMYVDPKGLLTKCKSGLHVLGGKQAGPLHHEFSCFKTDDGRTVCRGFGRDPESTVTDAVINSVPGTVLKDDDNYSSDTTCEPDDNDKCMDKCAADLYAGMETSPPPYSLSRENTTQCQEANRKVVDTSTQLCAAQRK